jgi:predicted Zn-ribbon and HTH transcriptional regulator
MLIRIAMAGLLTLFVGCAAKIPEPASSTNHPANAGAMTTDLPTVGSILVPAKEQSVHEADPFPSATKSSGSETQDHMDHNAPATAESTAATTTEPAATYVCPMHADVTASEPGRCPKCKMKLVQKRPK